MENEPYHYTGEDRRRPQWEFKREVSVGNMLTLVALAAPLIIWAINIDKRLTLLESLHLAQQKVDDRQEQLMLEIKREIRTELTTLNAKVDRILERNGNGSGPTK